MQCTWFNTDTKSIENLTSLRLKFGTMPSESTLRSRGYKPYISKLSGLRGNPTTIVYDPIDDVYVQQFEFDNNEQLSIAQQLNVDVADIREKIEELRLENSRDTGEDNALMTLVANLTLRVAALENNP